MALMLDTFLAALWRSGAWAYTWRIKPDGTKESLWFPAQTPPPVPEVWTGSDVYIGVHPTAQPGKPHSRALKAANPARPDSPPVAVVNCLFAEFDAKDFGDKTRGDGKAAILEHLNRLWEGGLPYPSVLVDSGGGYHAYWLLEYPLLLDDATREKTRIGAIAAQAAWVALWGGDDGAKDLARVLRLPGTLNHKYDPPRPVSFHPDTNLERVYRWEHLTSLLPAPVLAPASAPARADEEAADHKREGSADDNADDRERARRFGEGERRRLLAAVANAPAGKRNYTVNRSAFLLGRMVGGGVLEEDGLSDALTEAGTRAGLPEAEARKEANNGLRDGRKSPRGLPAPQKAHVNGNGAAHVNGAAKAPDDRAPVGDFRYRAEDGGILDCWLDREGPDWLYVTGYERWHFWSGAHWAADECRALPHSIQALMDQMNEAARAEYAALPPKPEGKEPAPAAAERAYLAQMIAATKRTQGRVFSVSTMAQAQRAVRADALDSGNLLNLQNGTLDLDTFAFRPHDKRDCLTVCLDYAYDPDARAPRWGRFVREVFVKEERTARGEWVTDDDLAELFQEAMGYSLTNDTRHEAMFWILGEANSGKSTIQRVQRDLLGGLTLTVNLAKLGEPGNYTLAKVPGKRLLQCSESRKGAGFNEEIVRKLVSGQSDVIEDARAIYGTPFEFRSVSKLWWVMNDLPTIKDTSNAIWRRLQLIPFYRTWDVSERDVTLGDTLRGELPGILNWAIEGLQRLRARGRFPEPKAAEAAKETYRREANPVQQWMNERTIARNAHGEQLWTPAAVCHKDYAAWALEAQHKPLNNTNFGREMGKLAPRRRGERSNEYGVGLLTPPAAAPAV